MSPLFSGEPLPIPPHVADVEIENFHRKLIEYLRRLAAKIDGKEFREIIRSTTTEAFAAVLTGDIEIPASLWTPVTFGKHIHRNPLYEVSGPWITVREAGLYMLHVNLLTTFTDSSQELLSRIVYRKATDITPMDRFLKYGYTMMTCDPGTHSLSIPVPIEEDDSISVQVKLNNAIVAEDLLAHASRLAIYRLSPDPFDGGTGGSTIDPYLQDPDGSLPRFPGAFGNT